MMLADPGLVVADRVEVLDQLHVALERRGRVLADRVERRQEDTETHVTRGHCPIPPVRFLRCGALWTSNPETDKVGAVPAAVPCGPPAVERKSVVVGKRGADRV